MKLVEAGKQDEAFALLSQPITITAAIGPRSARAALEAATLLFRGDVEDTARWMTEKSAYLGMRQLECAEQSEEGQQQVIGMINRLYHGVYL